MITKLLEFGVKGAKASRKRIYHIIQPDNIIALFGLIKMDHKNFSKSFEKVNKDSVEMLQQINIDLTKYFY